MVASNALGGRTWKDAICTRSIVELVDRLVGKSGRS
jgi:hypothetical protein